MPIKRILGSLIIIFVSIFLISDKIVDYYDIAFKDNRGFHDTQQYVWYLSNIIATIGLLICIFLRPYFVSIFPLIYIIILQLYWLYFSDTYSDTSIFQKNIFLISLLILIASRYFINYLKKYQYKQIIVKEKLKLLDNILDLNLLTSKKVKGDGR